MFLENRKDRCSAVRNDARDEIRGKRLRARFVFTQALGGEVVAVASAGKGGDLAK